MNECLLANTWIGCAGVIRIAPRQINPRTSLTVIWLESEDIPDSGEMPWKETDAMKERVKFVLEWERRWHEGEGKLNFAELCREFGISRQVGYVWVGRYKGASGGIEALTERSRRPHTSPTRVSEELEAYLVAARKLHPTWGPKKLRAWLLHHHPQRPHEALGQQTPSSQFVLSPRRYPRPLLRLETHPWNEVMRQSR
jgi:hypothetical protein